VFEAENPRAQERRLSRLDGGSHLTNNWGIVRKAIAVALSLAVPVAAVIAPNVHAHQDDHRTGHHHGQAVHAHWSGHSHKHSETESGTPTVRRQRSDRDEAVYLNAFVAVAASTFHISALVHSPFRVAVPPKAQAHLSVEVRHSHDPPLLRARPSRAPPSFLS